MQAFVDPRSDPNPTADRPPLRLTDDLNELEDLRSLCHVGGREPLVANARVRVTEPDGSTWTGVALVE